jgi:hypothetical protein
VSDSDRLEIFQKKDIVGGDEAFQIQWPAEVRLGNDFLYTREEITNLIRAASDVLLLALASLESGNL